MKVILAATIFLVVLGVEAVAGKAARNVVQFGSMISHVTGRSAFDYLEYGCYCGIGGSGTPVDDIDRCCQVHDRCYEAVYGVGLAHIVTYSWTGVVGGYVTCDNDFGTVARDACECDREVTYCFRRYPYPGRQPC
ncbi:PREDICTED: basic phospholipase A2 PA-11-like [Branchiostoma belcheri]|uniref:Phospholipase A2 n=1 Tax=Branchiostoma belcheri TaxID=7741 RepID=A0A6P4Z9C8_BRABE|nr:PREDICTED: basic phospholipase A2 PA-11-like [Branchiostoma belcheri]